jgi:hypothetical protein
MSKRDQFRKEIKGTVTGEVKVKKPRKKRKLTEEQKAVLVERMKKAREARGPAKNLSIDESIRDLPAEHPLNPNNVKDWLKYQKDVLKSMKGFKDSKDKNERLAYYDTEAYVFNLQRYLGDGVYRDFRYGEEKQNTIRHRSVAMAYYPDGTPKRTVGVFYPDLGEEYTQEMENEDNAARKNVSNKKRLRKTN